MSEAETILYGISVIIKAVPFLFWMLILCTIVSAIKNAKKNTRNVVVDVSGRAVGTNDYKHPCVGQCKDQIVVLNKSPTPMYKHNCRAPCSLFSRSGRYYKGKRRIRTW